MLVRAALKPLVVSVSLVLDIRPNMAGWSLVANFRIQGHLAEIISIPDPSRSLNQVSDVVSDRIDKQWDLFGRILIVPRHYNSNVESVLDGIFVASANSRTDAYRPTQFDHGCTKLPRCIGRPVHRSVIHDKNLVNDVGKGRGRGP